MWGRGAAGKGRWRTVQLEEVVVAGLGGELLRVDNGLLEGVALGGRHGFGVGGGGWVGEWVSRWRVEVEWFVVVMIRVPSCLAKEKKVGLSRAEKGEAAVLWRGKSRRGNGDWRHWGRTHDHLVPCWRGTCRGKPRRSATQHRRTGQLSATRRWEDGGRSGGEVHGWVGGSWDEN